MSYSRFLPSSIAMAVVGLLFLIFPLSAFGHEGWLTDMGEAVAAAKKEGKDILVDFSGSDWCHWCNVLNKEVFSQEAFAPVKDNFVLVSLDFPQDRSKMTKAQMEHNEKWRTRFEVSGFPIIFLLDAGGRPYARTGYQEGGPVKYLEHLGELQEVRKKRDAAMTLAKAAEGVERAKHIDAAISVLEPGLIWMAYEPLVKEVAKLDADDKLGLRTKYEEGTQRRTIGKEMAIIMKGFAPNKAGETAKKLMALEAKIKPTGSVLEDLRGMTAQMLVQGGEFKLAIEMANDMLSDPKRKGIAELNWRAVKVNALASQKNFDAALAELDEIAKNPAADGERAVAMMGLRAQVLVGAGREADAVATLDGFLPTVPSGALKDKLKSLREGISKRVESKKEEGDLAPAK